MKNKKEQLVEKMLKEKGNLDNMIDLDAYARGLLDMYEALTLNGVGRSLPKKELTGFKKWINENCGKPMNKINGHRYNGADRSMTELSKIYHEELLKR